MAVSKSLPNGCKVEEAIKSTVMTSDGKVISFGDILNLQSPDVNRILVVFIRHFFCGNCQEYIRRLGTELSPSTLPRDLSVVVVACGAPSLIPSYLGVTSCPFPLFADPSTQLYKLLGMHKSLSLGSKNPAYIQHSLASGMVKSIVQGLKRIPSGDVGKAGDLSVNGGEFLFVRDQINSDWRISWSHCMLNSRDHTEIDILKAQLDLVPARSLSGTSESEITSSIYHSDSSTCSSDTCDQPPDAVRRSTSVRRYSWRSRAGRVTRVSSLRRTVPVS